MDYKHIQPEDRRKALIGRQTQLEEQQYNAEIAVELILATGKSGPGIDEQLDQQRDIVDQCERGRVRLQELIDEIPQSKKSKGRTNNPPGTKRGKADTNGDTPDPTPDVGDTAVVTP